MMTRSPLRQLRKARTLTQQELARLVGVSQSVLVLYEQGKRTPSVDVQARLAAILGVSVRDLWGEGV